MPAQIISQILFLFVWSKTWLVFIKGLREEEIMALRTLNIYFYNLYNLKCLFDYAKGKNG